MLEGLLVDLAPFAPGYVDRLVTFWNNDSRIWATIGETAPMSRAQVQRLWDAQDAGPDDPGFSEAHWMLRAKGGAMIGSMSLWIKEWHRWAWVAAWIGDSAYWSGGYGTDGLLLLIDYAFRWLDLRRLYLLTMAINERARRNVERCGFRREAQSRDYTRFEGRTVDQVHYGLLRDEWPGREALVEQLGLRERAGRRYGKADE